MPILNSEIAIRRNARVVLINERNELLLMHVQLPSHSFWCTIGGGIKDQETTIMAAKRETYEEIGFEDSDIRWGKAIWYGEHIMNRKNIPTLHKETFIVGWTKRNDINCNGMTKEEQDVVQGFKWWSLQELQTTDEFIAPPSLATHFGEILRGKIPQTLMTIDLA